MRSRQEIEAILTAELSAARQRQFEAGVRFRQLLNDIPGTNLGSDGALSVRQAGEEYRVALDDLRRALLRFKDFTARGVVPDDLGGWRVR